MSDSTHVLDGLLYHESDFEITEHYTDTAGFTEHFFAMMHLLGEFRDWGLENQSYRASGLMLLTATITLWNTVYIERAIDSLKRKDIPVNEQLVAHLSPLGWELINPSGDYVWRNNLKLGARKYLSLRAVGTELYRKQY